jgi:hypothetical protein
VRAAPAGRVAASARGRRIAVKSSLEPIDAGRRAAGLAVAMTRGSEKETGTMWTGRSLVVVAALALVGCAAADDEDGSDMMVRVRFTGTEIDSVEVIDRAAPEEFADDLRPQPSGDMGILWTDYATGETLADGWMPQMRGSQDEFTLVVPAAGDDGALLTVTLPTASGPFVATAYVAP